MTKKELEQKTDSFVSTYLGQSKGYPDDSQYWGQCLSIVKLYIKEVFGISPPPSGTNSAYGYWSNFPNPLGEVFEKVLNTDDLIPEKGWIAIWQPWSSNPYGHISIVADGSTKSLCKNWAQNWTSRTFQLESNRYTNIIGFLKPKSIINDMTDNEKLLLGLINDNGITEGDIRWVIDLKAKQTVPKLEKKVSDLETEISEIKQQLGELTEKYNNNEKELKNCQSSLKTANQTIENISAELETANKEKTNYKSWYESKCKELNELKSKTTLIENIINFIKSLFKK
jgi:regulator of replication initiation timing